MRSLRQQSAAWLAAKAAAGAIKSLGTHRTYADAVARAAAALGVGRLKQISTAAAQRYLRSRAAGGVSQKTLDKDRVALQLCPKVGTLERVAQNHDCRRWRGSRVYTAEQIHVVSQRQDFRNALATAVAAEAGLRAHELATLARVDEQLETTTRKWSDTRFAGREDWRRYTVAGKGGLIREVRLSPPTAARLEDTRLRCPAAVVDRGIRYTARYGIASGQAWSQSFGRASRLALGWSRGAHGLRHSYAQVRVAECISRGASYEEARRVASQELGHFRERITDVYLK